MKKRSKGLATAARSDVRAANRKVAALAGGTAIAAAAVITPVVPPAATTARSIEVALAASTEYPFYTIGPLAGIITPLVNALGYNPFALPVGGISYDFSGGASNTRAIYNLFNSQAYTATGDITFTCKDSGADACRTAFVLSTGIGSLGTVDAIKAVIAAAEGNPPPGV